MKTTQKFPAARPRAVKRLAAAAASAALLAGLSISGATSASATADPGCYVIVSGSHDGCSHQSSLRPGQYIEGGTGNYALETEDEELRTQTDGNIVLYCKHAGTSAATGKWISAWQPVWATNQGYWNSSSGSKVVLWSDGNLAGYSYRSGLENVEFSSNTWNGSDTVFIVQADGNLVVWSGGRPVWSAAQNSLYHTCPGTEAYWVGY
ncbi:hypothetical protein ACFW1A_04915 [Kitasatospora sp. NPDC058965]|uniref:hypothetical protein n=1 Tax=Kitasatospora sp. NPDC058965 TaxID=3346682 RepID=UPI0036CF93B9